MCSSDLHWRTLLVALPSQVLPLGLFFYLPLRADSAPIFDSNPMQTWWETIRGEGFRGTLLQRGSLHIWQADIRYQIMLLRSWVGLLVLLLDRWERMQQGRRPAALSELPRASTSLSMPLGMVAAATSGFLSLG